MKIAVTGYNGNVGAELVTKYDVIPLECNLLDKQSVFDAIHDVDPDLVIHAGAMTSVEECEQNPSKAFEVNVRGTSNLVECLNHKSLIYLSTNHVFSGDKFFPYAEFHTPNPINQYGFTKWIGEHVITFSLANVIVVRSNRLFNKSLLLKAIEKDRVSQDFPTFIKRSFTFLPNFVECLMFIAEHSNNMPSLLHVSSPDTMSYYDFMCLVKRETSLFGDIEIIPRKQEIPGLPPRPFRCGFNVNLAKKYRVPIISTLDGIRRIDEDE
jgi:dTDP-4-dehydrorhamnose reductase